MKRSDELNIKDLLKYVDKSNLNIYKKNCDSSILQNERFAIRALGWCTLEY